MTALQNSQASSSTLEKCKWVAASDTSIAKAIAVSATTSVRERMGSERREMRRTTLTQRLRDARGRRARLRKYAAQLSSTIQNVVGQSVI